MKLVSWELARAPNALGLRTLPESEAQDDVLIVANESDVHGYLLSRLLITLIDRVEEAGGGPPDSQKLRNADPLKMPLVAS